MTDEVLIYRGGALVSNNDISLNSITANTLLITDPLDVTVVNVNPIDVNVSNVNPIDVSINTGISVTDGLGRSLLLSEINQVICASVHYDIFLKWCYALNSDAVYTISGGTANNTNGMLNLLTGASIGSYVDMYSQRAVRYLPSCEMLYYFTFCCNVVGSSGTYECKVGVANSLDRVLLCYKSGVMYLQYYRNGALISEIASNFWNNPQNIDYSKLNLFSFSIIHLGIGPIRLYYHNGTEMVCLHTLIFQNLQNYPHLKIPFLKMYLGVVNVSNNTVISVSSASMAAGVIHNDGQDAAAIANKRFTLPLFRASFANGPVITLRNKTLYGGLENYIMISLASLRIYVEGTTSNVVLLYLYKGMSLTGGVTTFLNVDIVNSCSEYNTGASTSSGGVLVWSGAIGRNSASIIDLTNNMISLFPGESITLYCDSISNFSISGSIDFFEQQ